MIDKVIKIREELQKFHKDIMFMTLSEASQRVHNIGILTDNIIDAEIDKELDQLIVKNSKS